MEIRTEITETENTKSIKKKKSGSLRISTKQICSQTEQEKKWENTQINSQEWERKHYYRS